MAELSGSAIFSMLYFIFITRFLDPAFDSNLILLGLLIGASYLAGVYIPFHTYRIHIIPFISIIRALQKKKPEIILYKIPAQIIGAFVGTFIYYKYSLLTNSTIHVSEMWTFKVESQLDLIFFNILTVFVLCYLFYIIQLIFKNMGFTSTFYYALVIQVVFIFTCQVSEVSSLNVFGYLSIYLLQGNPGFSSSWFMFLLTHFIFPAIVAVLIYYYIRDRFIEKRSSTRAKQTI